jgi:hypothetical protein
MGRFRWEWLALAAAGIGAVTGAALTLMWSAAPEAVGGMSIPAHAAVLHVPRLEGSIDLDAEGGETSWQENVARTGAFLAADGTPEHPYSDVRMVWGDGQLYVMLYAADENIKAVQRNADAPLWLDDSFHMVFRRGDREYVIDVSPQGTVTDGERTGSEPANFAWQSGARTSVDMDGTLNDESDDDEEWVVEMAIPLAALGWTGTKGETLGFFVSRCDTPRGVGRTCGRWGSSRADTSFIVLD